MNSDSGVHILLGEDIVAKRKATNFPLPKKKKNNEE